MRCAFPVAAIVLTACFSPNIPAGGPCDPSQADSCPLDQHCVAQGSGGTCALDGTKDSPDPGSGDTPPCLGNNLLGKLCLSAAPAGPVSLSANINTASTDGNCTEIHSQPGGPPLCIVAGTTITVPANATLRGIGLIPPGSTASGSNALVLFATESITIAGAIDVSSHSGEALNGATVVGAGARTAPGCLAVGIDGTNGLTNGNGDDRGGGGGAGGSFGGLGGAGGFGGNSSNASVGHGAPVAANAPSVLIGGCPGGRGGDGASSAGTLRGSGAGGNAGGAIYLLAGGTITISGQINASGSGGAGGTRGDLSSGGGGGAGAGGMIGLEASSIVITGKVFANGGGGGGGGGNVSGALGTPGADATMATAAAAGGTSADGGGAGGAGSIGATVAVSGQNGSGDHPQSAGGGGGGGAGVIRIYGSTTTTGQISPPRN